MQIARQIRVIIWICQLSNHLYFTDGFLVNQGDIGRLPTLTES